MRKATLLLPGLILGVTATVWLVLPNAAQIRSSANSESVRSSPPDANLYFRPAIPADRAPGGKKPFKPPFGPTFPSVFISDTVVSNTDPNLTNTDTFGDSEPSIAITLNTPVTEIDILAFSGAWGIPSGSPAPLWRSIDGGSTWTKEFTIPIPPGVPAIGCPCDQTPDYGHGHGLSATFLTAEVNSGITQKPQLLPNWLWSVVGGVTQPTNATGTSPDQPWLLVNVDPQNPDQDDVYVAYDDFNGAPDMHVAASPGTSPDQPPNFTIDSVSGFSTGFVNPGHRLAVDHRLGTIYSLFQQVVTVNGDGSKNINYVLNRSTDGDRTWGLNGSPTGIVVANGDSNQPTPKFGTVNALLGGVDHAAVDPRTGDVYVVYGNRDPATLNNRLSIVRLTDNGAGGLNVGPSFFVTGQVQAALPSVAVASDNKGSVGVLYDTFDGFDVSGFPIFSAHFALSQDHGVTFTDVVLETFLSPAKDNGNPRQRVLGDYQQLKAAKFTFYGVFTGNGVPFGRPFANTDAIFFRTGVNPD
jgi:hypothetical protein